MYHNPVGQGRRPRIGPNLQGVLAGWNVVKVVHPSRIGVRKPGCPKIWPIEIHGYTNSRLVGPPDHLPTNKGATYNLASTILSKDD